MALLDCKDVLQAKATKSYNFILQKYIFLYNMYVPKVTELLLAKLQ